MCFTALSGERGRRDHDAEIPAENRRKKVYSYYSSNPHRRNRRQCLHTVAPFCRYPAPAASVGGQSIPCHTPLTTSPHIRRPGGHLTCFVLFISRVASASCLDSTIGTIAPGQGAGMERKGGGERKGTERDLERHARPPSSSFFFLYLTRRRGAKGRNKRQTPLLDCCILIIITFSSGSRTVAPASLSCTVAVVCLWLFSFSWLSVYLSGWDWMA